MGELPADRRNARSGEGRGPILVVRGRQTKSLFREDSAAGILPQNINQPARHNRDRRNVPAAGLGA